MVIPVKFKILTINTTPILRIKIEISFNKRSCNKHPSNRWHRAIYTMTLMLPSKEIKQVHNLLKLPKYHLNLDSRSDLSILFSKT